MAQGEFALINQHLTASMQKPPIGWNPVGNHEILVLMADTAADQRNAEALSNTAEQAETISMQLGHKLYHAISLRALGILDWLKGNYSLGEAHLLEAMEMFQKLETRWQVGRTLYDLADLLVEQGRNHEAVEHYRRAVIEYESMQAQPSAERARNALGRIAHTNTSFDHTRSRHSSGV